jgi:hypothetical protein
MDKATLDNRITIEEDGDLLHWRFYAQYKTDSIRVLFRNSDEYEDIHVKFLEKRFNRRSAFMKDGMVHLDTTITKEEALIAFPEFFTSPLEEVNKCVKIITIMKMAGESNETIKPRLKVVLRKLNELPQNDVLFRYEGLNIYGPPRDVAEELHKLGEYSRYVAYYNKLAWQVSSAVMHIIGYSRTMNATFEVVEPSERLRDGSIQLNNYLGFNPDILGFPISGECIFYSILKIFTKEYRSFLFNENVRGYPLCSVLISGQTDIPLVLQRLRSISPDYSLKDNVFRTFNDNKYPSIMIKIVSDPMEVALDIAPSRRCYYNGSFMVDITLLDNIKNGVNNFSYGANNDCIYGLDGPTDVMSSFISYAMKGREFSTGVQNYPMTPELAMNKMKKLRKFFMK